MAWCIIFIYIYINGFSENKHLLILIIQLEAVTREHDDLA